MKKANTKLEEENSRLKNLLRCTQQVLKEKRTPMAFVQFDLISGSSYQRSQRIIAYYIFDVYAYSLKCTESQ